MKRPKRKRKAPAKIVWCDRGWMPAYYGFCPNARAWDAMMRHYKVANPEPYPVKDGRVTHFEGPAGELMLVVTIGDRLDESNDPIGLMGLLTHEAVHVFQRICREAGERNPSREFEAYAVQNIAINLMAAYQDTRGRKIVFQRKR